MHEGPFDKHEAEGPPIWPVDTAKGGGICEDWLDIAERIAHTERNVARWLAHVANRCARALEPKCDDVEPGFLMVGSRDSLRAVAETASGAIEYGQAFLAWAHVVGNDPLALASFDQAFLGSWENAAAFASEVMGELGPLSADASEEDRQMQMLLLANELADELQRRGVICTVPNNDCGVWVFRLQRSEQPVQAPVEAKGGDDA